MSAIAVSEQAHGLRPLERLMRLAGDPEAERSRLADAYAGEHLRAEAAAAAGFVDELVEPTDTRARLGGALRTLAGGRG